MVPEQEATSEDEGMISRSKLPVPRCSCVGMVVWERWFTWSSGREFSMVEVFQEPTFVIV